MTFYLVHPLLLYICPLWGKDHSITLVLFNDSYQKVLNFHMFRLIKRFKVVDQASSFSGIAYIEYSMFYRVNHYRLIFFSAYIPLKFIYGNGFSKVRRGMMNCRKHLINGMRWNIGSVCYLLNIQSIEKWASNPSGKSGCLM